MLARARPDALLCANDLLAVGAMAALRSAGNEIPLDVAVVGMDNSDLTQIAWPTLTSVDLGSVERARRAVELLFARIDDPARPPQRVQVAAELVVRASSTQSKAPA